MKILQKYLPENQRDTTMGSNRVPTSKVVDWAAKHQWG